ncbi:STE/STE20/STLK protein kinase [Salpingoeca rosetta]|uniref:STE/STE20/STLK protein kinase n=1 Tax=Salpingoeca rosetta (strain ATCC 50818 / BSB-021) TaxID=946362 RepID=F2U4R7_SALR5|nr:STE/STE20/STLK protein kinase [Salpingoeca rosetta]EGD82633.1 STE/STE20/STLK protein kinase [Salpingoeca rosetta]|eukprot:XP_004995869.1 STE/STE20/STLK protein kinase [Salpingoeca rosetta]
MDPDMVSSTGWPTSSFAYQINVVSGWDAYNAARICRAHVLATNELVTIRCLNAEVLTSSEQRLQDEVRAAVLSRQLAHPNIYQPFVHFVTADDPAELWTVGPYTPQGSLRDLLDTTFPNGCDEVLTATVLHEVLQALVHLHKLGIVHNRINAESVVITEALRVCITNFQYSRDIHFDGDGSGKLFDCPTDHSILPWLAPEVISQAAHGYMTKADIYGLGVLALEMLNGDQPYAGLELPQMLLYKIQGIKVGVAPTKNVSRHMKVFLSQCLNVDPDLRPSASDLLRHPLFRQVRRVRATVDRYMPRTTRPVISIPEDAFHFGLPLEEPDLPDTFERHAFPQLFQGGLTVYQGESTHEHTCVCGSVGSGDQGTSGREE